MAEEQRTKKMNYWKISAIVLGVLLVLSVFTNGLPFTGFFAKESKVQPAIDFINNNLIQNGEVTLKDVSEESGLYKLTLEYQGEEIEVHATEDGKYLILPGMGIINIKDYGNQDSTSSETETQSTEVPKTDKPEIELFVMSYCPYGTQIEKGLIPVLELLKDKVDFNLDFVFYAMHGEKEVKEQMNQVCIREEQNDKLLPYLKCFLDEGNSQQCLESANIDTNKLKSCTDKLDKEFDILDNLNDQSKWLSGRYPLFNVDKDLNDEYGVQGSPTLVINGVQVSSGRSSSELLSVVCDAFTNAPEECSQELSTESPSTGFGYSTTTSTTSGSCS